MGQATVNFRELEFMTVEEHQTLNQLGRIVGQIQSHSTLDEDLMQEALIHLWQIQEQHAAQTKSWYLQNCRIHLQHHLMSGRSVDSLKRRNFQVHVGSESDAHDSFGDNLSGPDTIVAEVSAGDLLFALRHHPTAVLLANRDGVLLVWLCYEWRR